MARYLRNAVALLYFFMKLAEMLGVGPPLPEHLAISLLKAVTVLHLWRMVEEWAERYDTKKNQA